AGKKIVGLIVFPHMVEAEAPVLALAISPLRRPMGRRVCAIGPIAARLIGLQPTVFAGLDPNPIVQGRVELHGLLWEGFIASRKLDRTPRTCSDRSNAPCLQ